MKATAEERITKAKITITYSNPFFAYLSLYLTIEEDKIGIVPENCGMSVSPTGHLYYRKEFVDEITDAQLLGVLNHEILHLGLLHLVRCGRKNRLMWNIATDLVANTILIKNGYELPKALKPNIKNQFVILNKIIQNVDSKSAEEIYEELPEIPEQKTAVYILIDNHENKDGKGEPLTESEMQKLETEWFNKVQTAMVLAQQRGNLPAGLERYVDELKKAEINWRVVLRKFIQQSIPTDYSWSNRSKKGYALDIYLPSIIKEKIDIVVGVDTSGSIGDEELTKFVSEIIGIAKAFREVVDMRIMFHDTEVSADYLIKNGNIPQIMAMKVKGGGGTSHQELLDKIKKEVKDCKCLVSFTDGYSDLESINLGDYKFSKLFIINKNGTVPEVKGEATFIKLKDE
jgi:predicted metal-dependent peptidase